MTAARILAILLGTLLGCAASVIGLLWFAPQLAKRWEWQLGLGRPPVIQSEIYTKSESKKPCPPSRGALVDVDGTDDPLVELEQGTRSKHKTIFARFGRGGFESRTLFFVLKGAFVSVDARFDADYGNFVGTVQSSNSDVHVHEEELCFDLLVELLNGSNVVEHWQGRLPLQ